MIGVVVKGAKTVKQYKLIYFIKKNFIDYEFYLIGKDKVEFIDAYGIKTILRLVGDSVFTERGDFIAERWDM